MADCKDCGKEICDHAGLLEQIEGAPEGIVRCFRCGKVGRRTEVWARPCGYLRPVDGYNAGKKAEFYHRKDFKVE